MPTQSRLLWLVVLVCAAGMCLYWVHLKRNWGGSANPTAALRTDLFAQWYGTRALLLQQRNPYSDDVTREIQVAYYGQELGPAQQADISHQQRFAYPLYIVFLIAPTVNLPYPTVEFIWRLVLACVAAASVIFWTRAIHLSLTRTAMVLTLLVFFASIPTLQALDLVQMALLVAGLLAGATACAASGRLFFAGVLLALATIKPQLSLIPISWFTLWAVFRWRQRRALLAGLALALAALVLAAQFLMPGWLHPFADALMAYQQHTRSKSLLGVLLNSPFSWIAAVAVIALGLPLWRHALREPADSSAFALAVTCSLTVTTLVMPATFQPFNYVVLLPAFLLMAQNWKTLCSGSRLSMFAVYCCCAFSVLPWPCALLVDLGRFHPFERLQTIWFAPLNASLALPFAAMGLLILLRNASARAGRELAPNLLAAGSAKSR